MTLPGRILVTGGSGFIGRAVLRLLTGSQRLEGPRSTAGPGSDVPTIRLLVHRTVPSPLGSDRPVECVSGDLGDPASLSGVCDDIDTVLHLASHISDDAVTCDRINGRGTEALVDLAAVAGVRRLVYVSSAAVYGWAIHSGAAEDAVAVAPVTPVSRSRIRAEQAVLDAGGIVLRPLFVYGDGDTRFIPVVLRAIRRLPFLVDRGRARVSVVCVDDLADVVVAAATHFDAGWTSRVFHVTDGNPLEFRELALCLSRLFDVRMPRRSIPYPLVRLLVRAGAGSITGAENRSKSAAHRLFLVARDHYYDSSAIWKLTGLQPGEPLVTRVVDLARWYGRPDAASPAANPDQATGVSPTVATL